MIEPPAKRLRILQSVEVDETNPDYIEAKHKQQQKFKGRLERIFEKYGSMHESMSDEIDFTTGKVVVDRGHIRRVQRQMLRKGPSLVDNLLEPSLEQEERSEGEGGEVESEDELAPIQTAKKRRNSVEVDEGDAHPVEQPKPDAAVIATTPQTTSTLLLQGLQAPNTPNQATYLYQQIQQTPLDQQMQAALFANLNQIQAAQQALASLLSILQNTPNAPNAQAPLPTTIPEAPGDDNVRPAADPKWYFPPISAAKATPRKEHREISTPLVGKVPQQIEGSFESSSPLVSRRRSPKVRISRHSGTSRKSKSQQASVEENQSSHSLPASTSDSMNRPGMSLIATEKPGHTAKPRKTTHRYKFTAADDIYISEKRQEHNMSFKDIKASNAKWSEWPISAFQNRWQNHLKGKQLHLQETPRIDLVAQRDASTAPEPGEHFFSSIEIPETSSAEHHLPTPSSLEQEGPQVDRAAMLSSSHFDDDDLELLSLAGTDVGDEIHSNRFNEDDDYPTPDEPLPSIEGAEFRNEDDLQLEMLKTEQSPTPDFPQLKVLPSTIPETQESIVAASPPSQQSKAARNPGSKPTAVRRATSNSSDDIDLIGANDEPSTPRTYIKCKSLTPQATRILCSSPALKTPRLLHQSSGLVAKSTGKLNRRAYLNDVKKSWTKKASAKTPSSRKRRRSLNDFARGIKRARTEIEVSESEDELAV